MLTPGLFARAPEGLRARLWSWLGVGALVMVVGVAFLYAMTVEPSLLPNERVLIDELEKATVAEAEFFGEYARRSLG